MAHIYPSLLAADPLNLEKAVTSFEPHVCGFHLDIIDNHFAPNLTWGKKTVDAIARITNKKIWLHLMVTNPSSWVRQLELPAGTLCSVHSESNEINQELIESIKRKGWTASLALKPDTACATIIPFIPSIDHVLVMAVQPGFSGQAFIPATVTLLDTLLTYKAQLNPTLAIGIDGGINKETVALVKGKQIDDYAVGSALFGAKDPLDALKYLEQLI